jgi:hypothetical protein
MTRFCRENRSFSSPELAFPALAEWFQKSKSAVVRW